MRHFLAATLLVLAGCAATPEPGPAATGASSALELYRQALAARDANDDAEAQELMRRSAEAGYAEACHEYGLWLYLGTYRPRNPEAAAGWLLKAAEQGIVDSQLFVAQMYLFGRGLPLNEREALRWFTRAAEAGSAEAQYRVGMAYDEGVGAAPDPIHAMKWLKLASDQGHLDATYHLAVLTVEGDGTPPDATRWTQAIALFKQGAEGGHGPCQLALGQCYERGEGLPRDDAKARQWYEAAAGSPDVKVAQEARNRLKR
ncbi:sel1 repeat family protein [bacterium]|nr:MAG: sel1 repeat family protein [bacterium]RIK61882.1 MAG: hypothetical protein DCC64_11990 [Planctomycetota bacterium]